MKRCLVEPRSFRVRTYISIMAAQRTKRFLVICLFATALVSLLLLDCPAQRQELSAASFAFLSPAVTAAKQLPSPQTSGSLGEGKDEGLRVDEFLRADDLARIQKLTQSFQVSSFKWSCVSLSGAHHLSRAAGVRLAPQVCVMSNHHLQCSGVTGRGLVRQADSGSL